MALYRGRRDETLDQLRYKKYCENEAGRKAYVQPQTLPPTSLTAKYHSLRVYLQVRQWKGQDYDSEEIQHWGWKMATPDQLLPVMSDKAAAPDYLIQVIRCNCSTDCSTRRCNCRKNGLECSPACGQRRGDSCSNCTLPEIEENGIEKPIN